MPKLCLGNKDTTHTETQNPEPQIGPSLQTTVTMRELCNNGVACKDPTYIYLHPSPVQPEATNLSIKAGINSTTSHYGVNSICKNAKANHEIIAASGLQSCSRFVLT